MARWLVLVLLVAAQCFADYSPPSIRMLVLGSDAIVEGTISNTSAGPEGKNFVLKVRSVVVGPITTPRACFTATISKDGWRVESARLSCSAETKAAAERAPLTAALFRALAKN